MLRVQVLLMNKPEDGTPRQVANILTRDEEGRGPLYEQGRCCPFPTSARHFTTTQ